MAILSGVGGRRRVRRGVLLGLALALLTAVPVGAAGVGQRAPEFTLPDWQGRPTTLAEGGARVTIVDFWASWCTPCAPMLPALDGLVRGYGGLVRVLAVDLDQSRTKAEAFLRDNLPSPSPFMTILADPAAAVLARYGAEGMPAVFVVDGEGTIRFTDAGYSPEHARDLAEAVRGLIPGQPAVRDRAPVDPEPSPSARPRERAQHHL